MKRLLLAVVMIAAASTAYAQGVASNSSANSGSQSSAEVNVGSQSGAFIYQEASVIPTSTTTRLENVPAVSAPSILGGGHPCLAGKSGGIAVAGFGGSYGEGKPEPICMLWYMGQAEAAVRLLVMTDKGACVALGNVGYYRVGKSVIPFACGETVKGGVDTPGFISRKTRVSASAAPVPVSGLKTCEKRSGKVYITYKYGADKVSAKAACLSSLGY